MTILIRTSNGDIRLKLHQDTAPKTVENFLSYVNSGFYNDTVFHRVIDGFMIQGGGFTKDMVQKPTQQTISNEAKGAASNKRGTIAMARTMAPHSATAQFFINVVDNHFLDYKGEEPSQFGYCVFGEVIEGMDVVDQIAKLRTGTKMGHGDVPLDDVVIYEIIDQA